MKSFVSGRRIKRTLLSALVVRSLLFAVVAFVPTAVVTAYFQEKSVAVSFKRAARLLADGKASEINPILVQVEHSVSALEQRLLLTLDEEQFVFNESYRQDYLRESEVWFEDIARFTPGAATSWFRLEKERFGPTAGIFMTTDHFSGFVSVKPTNLADYAENDREHVGWYYEPLALGKPMWMHPYENKNVAIKMITYVIPLYRQGKFLGVVGMDIEMAYLKRFVDDIRWDDACAFLFDSDGNLMYHQDYPDGHPAIMFDAELAHLAESAMSGNTDTMYTWKWHEDTFHVVYARLQNGSVLALALSDGVARRARIQITVMRLFLLLVIACLLFFMGYFVVRRILTPISQLTESARRLSRGELGTVIAYHGDNEIGLLSHSLRMMEKQLKEYISYIRMQAESERKAKELALNASRAKSDFLANMSHEIRTPINAVLGMNEMILRENTDENIKGYAVNIRNAGNTLLSLINDILDFSKIEAGKMEIICARYDLALLLVDLMVLVGDRAEQKDLTLELKANPQIPKFLVGDSMRLKQCMLNILTNAVKYTEQGTVTFSVDFAPIDGDSSHILLKVSVRDTGIGIKKEDIPKLFDRFSQVDNQYTRKVEGTGLGLALSKELAKMLNGDLTVTSEVGVGSCFCVDVEQKAKHYYDVSKHEEIEDMVAYIYAMETEERWYLTRILSQLMIPSVLLHDEEQLTKLEEYKSKESEKQILFYSYEKDHALIENANLSVRKIALMQYYTSTKQMNLKDSFLRTPYDIFKVLKALRAIDEKTEEDTLIHTKNTRVAIVDDNKVNLKVAITLLRQFDVQPEAFSSGAGILKALENGREYDIIFMDHMMPEMDGIETTKKIREMSGAYAKKAIIIALTANAINGVEEEYIEAGMNDWLFKPVNTVRIQEKLIKYLSKEKIVKG